MWIWLITRRYVMARYRQNERQTNYRQEGWSVFQVDNLISSLYILKGTNSECMLWWRLKAFTTLWKKQKGKNIIVADQSGTEGGRMEDAIDKVKEIARYRRFISLVMVQTRWLTAKTETHSYYVAMIMDPRSSSLERLGYSLLVVRLSSYSSFQSALQMSIRECFLTSNYLPGVEELLIEKVLNEHLVERFITKWWLFKKQVSIWCYWFSSAC